MGKQSLKKEQPYVVVNFKRCIEGSKIGQKERVQFEEIKNEMEGALKRIESVLDELSKKLNDAEFLKTLAPPAVEKLKHQFNIESQEMAHLQNNYYQALNQANIAVLQKVGGVVRSASQEIAKQMNIPLIFNSELLFYYDPVLDISDDVVTLMDSHEGS